MRLTILLAAVMSIAWVETKNAERPIRAPQGQIRHDTTVAGGRVDWKYVTPQEQWRSRAIGNAQRIQRAEGGSSAYHQRQVQRQATPQRQKQQQQQQQQLQRLQSPPQPVQQAQQQIPGPQYYSYKPYTAVPGHIKQLIQSVYQPQVPYVDPTSFLYSSSFVAPQQYEHQQQQQEQQQPAPAASELPETAYQQPSARYQSIDPRRIPPRHEYSDRRYERQDRVYGDEYEQQQQQQQQQEQQQQEQQQQEQVHQIAALPIGVMPEPPLPTLYIDRNMPTAIRQLLQYQAQIPYDVTANRIQYTPKHVFIPKPLGEDVKGPYHYRSKVYYTGEDGAEDYQPDQKPVDEEQRH